MLSDGALEARLDTARRAGHEEDVWPQGLHAGKTLTNPVTREAVTFLGFTLGASSRQSFGSRDLRALCSGSRLLCSAEWLGCATCQGPTFLGLLHAERRRVQAAAVLDVSPLA